MQVEEEPTGDSSAGTIADVGLGAHGQANGNLFDDLSRDMAHAARFGRSGPPAMEAEPEGCDPSGDQLGVVDRPSDAKRRTPTGLAEAVPRLRPTR